MPGKGIQARRLQKGHMFEIHLHGPELVPSSEGSSKTSNLHASEVHEVVFYFHLSSYKFIVITHDINIPCLGW